MDEQRSRRLYTGGCHCGDVRFEVDGPLDGDVLDCNCSICRKKGFLHWIVPPTRFRLLTAASSPTSSSTALTTYTFGTGTAKHTFCARCGIAPFYTPRSHPDHVDVNVRCLDDVDVGALIAAGVVVPYDGGGDWERARIDLSDREIEQIKRS